MHDLDAQLSHLRAQQEQDLRDVTHQVQDLDLQRSQLQDRVRTLEAKLQLTSQESDAKFGALIASHEAEMESMRVQAAEEVRVAQAQSEVALGELKGVYEREKEKLEGRIQEERDRLAKRMATIQEELEQRMRDEALERDEEIECLQNELREAEQRH